MTQKSCTSHAWGGSPPTANVMSPTSVIFSSQTSPRAQPGSPGALNRVSPDWLSTEGSDDATSCVWKRAYIFISRTYDDVRAAAAFSGPLSSSDVHRPIQWQRTYSPWSSASPGHPPAWPPRWLAGPPLWSPGPPPRPSCILSSLSLWPFASGCRRCLRCLCLDYYRQPS